MRWAATLGLGLALALAAPAAVRAQATTAAEAPRPAGGGPKQGAGAPGVGPDGADADPDASAPPPTRAEAAAGARAPSDAPEASADEPTAEAASEAEVEPEPEPEGGADPDGEAAGPRSAEDAGDGEDVVESLGAAIGNLGQTLRPGASSHPRIRWDPRWPRYNFDELVLTLGVGLVIGLEEALPTRTDPNWQAVTDLDLEVASALGLRSASARDTLEELSDGIAGALFVWPVLFDSLLYAGLGEGAWDVAWQLSLISLEVFAINHALTVMVRLLTRRERPLGRFCRQESGYDADPVCADPPPAESFWSAHTSNAFAGAALVCMHHDVLDLFGDEAADGLACGTALAAAATTGLFRIMSDHQWVTDVMTGAVVGSLSGILIPWLLHFQGGARPPLRGSDAPPIALTPMVGPGTVGVSGFGLW